MLLLEAMPGEFGEFVLYLYLSISLSVFSYTHFVSVRAVVSFSRADSLNLYYTLDICTVDGSNG